MPSELNFSYFFFCGWEENIHFHVLNSLHNGKKRSKNVTTQVEMMSTTTVASVQCMEFLSIFSTLSVHFFLSLHCFVVAILLCTQPNKLAGEASLLYSWILTFKAAAMRTENGRWSSWFESKLSNRVDLSFVLHHQMGLHSENGMFVVQFVSTTDCRLKLDDILQCLHEITYILFNWLKWQQFKSSSFWTHVAARQTFFCFALWKFDESLILIETSPKYQYKPKMLNCFMCLALRTAYTHSCWTQL